MRIRLDFLIKNVMGLYKNWCVCVCSLALLGEFMLPVNDVLTYSKRQLKCTQRISEVSLMKSPLTQAASG